MKPSRLPTPKRGIILSGVTIAVVALATVLGARAYEDRLELVRHTVEVQRQLTVVLSGLQDAETGQRGYLLTGEPSYLQPYEGAQARVARDVERLATMVADNPAQQAAAHELTPLIEAKFQEMDRTIDLRREGRAEEAMNLVWVGVGRQVMDDLRSSLSAMSDRESELLSQRSAQGRLYSYGLFTLIGVLVCGAFASLLLWLNQAQRAAELLRQEASQRSQAEGQVRQLQKMEAIGQLTGGIAHDFNNMLAVVIGNIEQARRHIENRAKLEARLDGAMEGATRAATLTSRLLAFSRKQPLEPQSLEINKLVSGMSDMLLRTLKEDVRIETVLAGGLWRALADPAQVESALLNLAVNARDAMPGGGKLTIETGNAYLDDSYAARQPDAKAGQYVMISVTDTGTGMAPEVAAKAFEPFFTTKETGKGTGLGLSQIYGFAKQTGGHARIYSEPGKGTTVKLYLPRDFSAATASGPAYTETEATLPQGAPDKVVLVVEDEESLRLVTVDSLRSLGYSVRHAADGDQALKLLDELGTVDLLFTDIVMPGMNGRELADEAQKTRPELKVLYTTGYTRNAVVHNGVLDPGVALLSKPFTLDQLAVKVNSVLTA